MILEDYYLLEVMMHFLSSGFAGLLGFLSIWTISGKYLVWKNQSILPILRGEHYTQRLYLSCMVAFQAAFLTHMQIDRSSLGGVWIYLKNELLGIYHPYVGVLLIMIAITVVIGLYVQKRLK